MLLLTYNYPEDQRVAHHRDDDYEGEGKGPQHVRVAPGDRGARGTANINILTLEYEPVCGLNILTKSFNYSQTNRHLTNRF